MLSKDIKIRTADASDAQALLEIYAPYIIKTAVTFEYEVPLLSDFQKRIETTLKRYPYLVAEEDGGILGYACIAYVDKEDEYLTRDSADFHSHLGYSMVGKFHRCGYKFGRWYDMVWMEKMLGEHPTHPQSVITFPDL